MKLHQKLWLPANFYVQENFPLIKLSDSEVVYSFKSFIESVILKVSNTRDGTLCEK